MVEMPTKRRQKGKDSFSDASNLLDDRDRAILDRVLRDPEITLTELGRQVGMSRPAVSSRLRRLRRERIITGWRLDLNPEALGFRYTIYMRIRPNGGQSEAVERVIRTLPVVLECYRTNGEDPLLLKMVVRTIPEFEEISARLERYGRTVSVDLISTLVPPRAPPLMSSQLAVATATK